MCLLVVNRVIFSKHGNFYPFLFCQESCRQAQPFRISSINSLVWYVLFLYIPFYKHATQVFQLIIGFEITIGCLKLERIYGNFCVLRFSFFVNNKLSISAHCYENVGIYKREMMKGHSRMYAERIKNIPPNHDPWKW